MTQAYASGSPGNSFVNASVGLKIGVPICASFFETDLDRFGVFLDNFAHFIFLAFHQTLRSQSQLSWNKAKHGSLK